MPVQKRPRSPPGNSTSGEPSSSPPLPSVAGIEEEKQHGDEQKQQEAEKDTEHPVPAEAGKEDSGDVDGEEDEYYEDEDDETPTSPNSSVKHRYMTVNLPDLRREVQCPICLGIIRKTRTVMECLHRFCRECIDKSMRLGNNECPACRTHCASRRSLRDDPKYDTIISILYEDIDQYEKEEFALHEEEKTRNRKIQASIAEIFRRQAEALGRRRSTAKATAVSFTRRSQGNFRDARNQSSYLRGRARNVTCNTSILGSDYDEEDEDVDANDVGKDSSSAEEHSPDVRPKRSKRWAQPRCSPARVIGNTDTGVEENDDTELCRENLCTSPLRAGNGEMLAWGKGGARSQTRHGNSSGSIGRFVKGGRITKLVEHLRNIDEKDDELDVHYMVLPLDERHIPLLQKPYLCSPSTMTIRQLCEFIALETRIVVPSEVEIFVRNSKGGISVATPSSDQPKSASQDMQIVAEDETLGNLSVSPAVNNGNLVLLYRLKITKLEIK